MSERTHRRAEQPVTTIAPSAEANKNSERTGDITDLEAQIARLQAMVDEKKADNARAEAWGAGDEIITTDSDGNRTDFEGYKNWLAERPDPVEDLLNNFDENGNLKTHLETKDYKSLSLMQLVGEARKMNELGDRAGKQEIFDAIQDQLVEKADKEGWTEQQMFAQLDRVEKLIDGQSDTKVETEGGSVAVDNADAEPAPLDVTPDTADSDEPAPLHVTPDAVDSDTEPAPLDVTPDADASAADTLPAPLEVTPDAHRDKFADFLNHPAVITRNWMRTEGDKLKARLDKFRGRPTKEKVRIIGKGMGMFAVGAVALYAAKQGYDALAFHEIGNNLGDAAGSGGTGTGGHGIANFMSSMSDAGERTFDTASAAVSNLELHSLSPEALTAHRGEGWESQLLQMGFSRSEISPTLNELLKSTDPGVMDWVYQMRDGNPGMAKSGQIPTDVLQSIMKMRG